MSFFTQGYEVLKNFIKPENLQVYKLALSNSIPDNYLESHFVLKRPIVSCPEIINLALSEKVQKEVKKRIGNSWGIGTCNLRTSFADNKPIGPRSTCLFHRDHNSSNFIKLFFYLNDVEIDGGPFVFVKNSHYDKREGSYNPGSRISDNRIKDLYGDDIVYLTASVGDLIIANTTGFHKGLKCENKDRHMLTINYTTEEEVFGKEKIKQDTYDTLSNENKFRCRFLEII